MTLGQFDICTFECMLCLSHEGATTLTTTTFIPTTVSKIDFIAENVFNEGEGKITYLLSTTFRCHFISNKQKQETLMSFLHKVTSFSAVKYDVSGD